VRASSSWSSLALSLALSLSASLGSASELRSVSVGDASRGESSPSSSSASRNAAALCDGAEAARSSCRRLVDAAHLRASRSRAGSTMEMLRPLAVAVGVSMM
jgi:hypothetical protein